MTFEGTHSYLKPTMFKKKKVQSPFKFENNLICERQSVVMTDWVKVFIIVVKKYLEYLLSARVTGSPQSTEQSAPRKKWIKGPVLRVGRETYNDHQVVWRTNSTILIDMTRITNQR